MWMVKGIRAARTNDLELQKPPSAAGKNATRRQNIHTTGTDGLGESFRLAVAAWISMDRQSEEG
jgi:hypothetical protein